MTKPPLAAPADAWGIVRNGKLLRLAMPGKPERVTLLPNERIARVRITEIEDDRVTITQEPQP